MGTVAAERNLLFGLLALQNGLIDQSKLVAAFQAWTLDKGRMLSDCLVARGDLDADDRAVVEALVERHIKKHGGDVERSLAAIPAGRSARENLARLGDPQIGATLAHIGSGTTEIDSDDTASYGVGTAAGDGQRFRVLRPHARGGLGAVFVALDCELHREVALKQIVDSHADDPVSRQRFVVEAEITGGLEHPGIVPVYGLGSYPDGRPYYAMRFVRGDSLKEAIERFHSEPGRASAGNHSPGEPGRVSAGSQATTGSHSRTRSAKTPGADASPLAFRRLLRSFLDVRNTIDYAHSRGVLHRDIKPGNIIVGQHGETLVVDWGLAKATGRADLSVGERTLRPSSASGTAQTLPGSAMGTPAYMSPEQAEGNLDALGPRSDVYSLGATLYCLLTGRPPFEGNVADMLRDVQRGAFVPPRSLDPSIDRALEAVCQKAMTLKPGERYDTCRALAEDVERWMADEPVSAWREPIARRARRWMRRHRTTVAVAAVALIAAVVGLGTVAAVQIRASAALRSANDATNRALAETRKAQATTQTALAVSEESRKQAEVVNSFLIEVFRSPDPTQSGRDIKVADLLDRAGAKIETDYAGTQATKGAVLNALGLTYRSLGLYDQAISMHTRALAVREAALRPDHPDILNSRNRLAIALSSAGRLSEAIELYEATLKTCEAKLGTDHNDTLKCRANLALAYWSAGRLADAIALNEATLKIYEAKLGPDHRDTLKCRNNLGIAYFAAGRSAEAIALHEVTLKLYEAKLGKDHPDTLQICNNLANAFSDVGRTAEAIALFEATIERMEAKLGPDHPDTLRSRSNLANAYDDAGRTAEAIALHQATLKLRERKLGPDHPNTLENRSNLALAYVTADRLSEAIALHEPTVKLYLAKLGPDHSHTLASRVVLAGIYESLGRWAEAERLDRDVLARRRKTLQPDSPLLAADLAALGGNLLNQGRWSEAERLLRDCLAIRQKAAPDDWTRFNAMSLLGGALLGAGRCAEAEPLVVPGYEGMIARESRITVPNRFHLRQAAERVIRLYEEWNKPEAAEAWKAKLSMRDLPADAFAQP